MAASDSNDAIRVRLWRPSDSAALAEISNQAAATTTAHFRCGSESGEEWEKRTRANPSLYPCFVAECAGQRIGFALTTPYHGGCGFRGVAEVSVYVREGFQGNGVGKRLYERLIPTLENQGFRQLIASITVGNPASERLHEHFEFSRVGVLTGVGWKFDRWHDVALWRRIFRTGDDAPGVIRSVGEVLGSGNVGSGQRECG